MSTLYVDNLQPNLGSRVMAAGHVVQVVTTKNQSQYGLASSAWTDTGISVFITPTSATSKILITADFIVDNQAANWRNRATFYRDATYLGQTNGQGLTYMHCLSSRLLQSTTMHYEDSPNTTSQVEYSIYFQTDGNYQLIRGDIGTTVITAMEIAQWAAS